MGGGPVKKPTRRTEDGDSMQQFKSFSALTAIWAGGDRGLFSFGTGERNFHPVERNKCQGPGESACRIRLAGLARPGQ